MMTLALEFRDGFPIVEIDPGRHGVVLPPNVNPPSVTFQLGPRVRLNSETALREFLERRDAIMRQNPDMTTAQAAELALTRWYKELQEKASS